jgi:hypothetical protein|tara:strand:+ start:987 stop:1253 length:267 start_codon:yes stop_codon:yes gene_type:complete
MHKKNFINSCDSNTYKVKQQLESIKDFILADAEFRKLLNINDWDKTVELEKLKIINYLMLECITKYSRPRNIAKHKKFIEEARIKLKI